MSDTEARLEEESYVTMALALLIAVQCMNNITEISLALSKNGNRKMALTRQQQSIESQMRYHVRDWHARIARVQENPQLQQQVPALFQNDASVYNTQIPVPQIGIQRSCYSRFADPIVQGTDAATGYLGETGDIRDDLRNFILNSGRVEGLVSAAMDPKTAIAVQLGSGNYDYNDPSFNYDNFPVFKEGTPRLSFVPSTGPNGEISETLQEGTTDRTSRFENNFYLDYLMSMAKTGTVPERLTGQNNITLPGPTGNETPQEWAMAQLMQHDDILREFVNTSTQYGNNWSHIGSAGLAANTSQYQEQATEQLKAFMTQSNSGTALTESDLQQWALQKPVPIFAQTRLSHYMTLGRAKGGAPDGDDMAIIEKSTVNAQPGKMAWQVDSAIDIQPLTVVDNNLESLKNQILDEQTDLDMETQQLTTQKEYWSKQLAAAQAEIPRSISRPWGQGGQMG